MQFDPDSAILDDLEPTPFELEERRHAIVTAKNERRERRRLRDHNQANGHDEPQPGTSLFIQVDGSLHRRGRAGLRFEKNQRVEVKIVDASDEDVRDMQRAGKMVVNPYGAERLLEDTSLHVFPQAMSDVEVGDLKAANLQLEEELRLSREELVRVRQQVRDARMSVEPSGDGRPVRLQAAAKAQAAAATAEAGKPAKAPDAPRATRTTADAPDGSENK
jgi:hypothetical protein